MRVNMVEWFRNWDATRLAIEQGRDFSYWPLPWLSRDHSRYIMG